MELCQGSLKERQKLNYCTSAGILVAILNCGIIVSISTLLGSESLSQVYMQVFDLHDRHGDKLPRDLGYDVGCHLRRFAELRKDLNEAAMRVWSRVGSSIFVDRFHWGNHVKTHAYCTENCNPSDNQRSVGANTEICEQSFRWFARHKYSLNHMSPARFRFFLLLIAAHRNEILLLKRAR